MTSEVRNIDVDYIARVEGEGEMHVKVIDGKIEDVWFGIFEPPRFYEAFLEGRPFSDAPDITARICGICPVAYQMSSTHAMEHAFGATVGGSFVPCAGCSTAENGSRAMSSTCSCFMPRTSSATRAQCTWRPTTRTLSSSDCV
jgi:hypothetical protein